MHLETVEIKNFRSLKDLKVSFQAGFNVLVGRNNTGKTNLFQAIRHALGHSASRNDPLFLDRDDFYRANASAEPATHISITLTFDGLSEDQRAHFFEIVAFDLTDHSKSKAIVRFEASWPKGKKHPSIKRTGGPESAEPAEVPTELLQSLPITFLPALRDAEAALAPGYRSRLATLLRDMVDRGKSGTKEAILEIFTDANTRLLGIDLIGSTAESLRTRTSAMAGTDHVPSTITAADADFEKILRTLQVQMQASPVGSLGSNGLGLNNLLYIAVVLEHLKHDSPEECPLLLVEEPEAHLHPQLTKLLADYLSNTTPGAASPQTIVSTHSPTLAASVPPNRVLCLFSDAATLLPRCNAIRAAGLTLAEELDLQRMMDVTRATLYFAKAAILVEGISETLLIPALAKRLGHDLAKHHISVIPICGVAFETFKKLLCGDALAIPVAIVSDADPPVKRGVESWEEDSPEMDGANFKQCDRLVNLLSQFAGHSTVKVSPSKLTLEYDLAEAGNNNALAMASAWEACFKGTPGTFGKRKLADEKLTTQEKAMIAWRGICRAEHTGSKAELAHRLAAALEDKTIADLPFEVPKYLKDAIEHVVPALPAPSK